MVRLDKVTYAAFSKIYVGINLLKVNL